MGEELRRQKIQKCICILISFAGREYEVDRGKSVMRKTFFHSSAVDGPHIGITDDADPLNTIHRGNEITNGR